VRFALHMNNHVWLLIALPALGACGDSHRWRSVLSDYARPDTVERLHAVLDGERARGDTARRLNRALSEKNEYLLSQLNELSSIVKAMAYLQFCLDIYQLAGV